jgi:serine/threonine protein phosphatase PrpC
MTTCPNCGEQNRPTAKFCRHCGADLLPTGAPLSTALAQDKPAPSETGIFSGLVKMIKRWVMGTGQSSPLQATPPVAPTPSLPTDTPTTLHTTSPPRTTPSAAPHPATRFSPLPSGTILPHPLNPGQRYSLVMARELQRSIYYNALDLTCATCGASLSEVPADGLCCQCQVPLLPVLIHERRLRPGERLIEADIEQLIQFSADHSHVQPHRAIIQSQGRVYTVVEHPGRWSVLIRERPQRSPDEALAGAVQIGKALANLHDDGFTYSEADSVIVENLIVAGGEDRITLVDLSTCARLQPDATPSSARVNSDVAFVAWLLFYLATGREWSPANVNLAHPTLRPFIEQALQGQYPSVQDLLNDFAHLPSTPRPDRSLKPTHGQATHPGHKHRRNEDAVATFTFDKEQEGRSVPIGFYLVADGLGGHDAGDLASRAVNQIVTDWIIKTKVLPDLSKATRKLTAEDVPGDVLTQAIKQANAALVQHGQARGSDLGSTVTAALVIGDVVTIANVGDSRTYLLRDGRLEQITQDHSLVARLVDAGFIQPEAVRTHPQRNRIYRCLGHAMDVEVDTFTRQLRANDVLLVCSDGLWEMVPDGEIQRIVEDARSPQKACDALVEAANRAGGEDNIGVIVVEME